MVVCVCNSIREQQVRDAARNGARSARCVFRSVGCKPKCAQCLTFAQSIITAETANAAA